LTSGAEIFFFISVVLVDVSAEDICWDGGGRREREREQRTHTVQIRGAK
jgi:hypothetical protein